MQQSRAMFTRRPRPSQLRILAEQFLQPRQVAADDRVHRRFEPRNWRIRAHQRFKVLCKLWPASEAMAAREKELRVGQCALLSAFIRLLERVPTVLYPFRFVVNLSLEFRSDLVSLQSCDPFCPARCPVADCACTARLARELKVFRELPVLFNVGTR